MSEHRVKEVRKHIDALNALRDAERRLAEIAQIVEETTYFIDGGKRTFIAAPGNADAIHRLAKRTEK